MKPTQTFSAAVLLVLGASTPLLRATPADWNQNWPQWRGPLATGEAPEANPPLRWSETTNVKWKIETPGFGTATPIVWRDKVFLLSAVPTGKVLDAAAIAAQQQAMAKLPNGEIREISQNVQPPRELQRFVVLCYDRSNGKLLWERTATEELPHEGHHRDHGYASASPITNGEHLFAYFGSRGLHCYDLQGNRQWSRDFGTFYSRKSFGEGSSPALHGDKVVVLWDHLGDDFITALDQSSGRELWRTPRDEPTAWTSPLIVEFDGKTQVIVAGSSGLRSYDLSNGHELWKGPALTSSMIPTPVAANGLAFAMSKYQGTVVCAVRLDGRGDLVGTDSVVWTLKRSAPYVSSPLLTDGLLYFGSGTSAMLSCVDAATGRIHYNAERLNGLRNMYASPVCAKDRVYVLSREGVCLVLRKDTTLEPLATNRLDDMTDASIALAGRDLFIRGHRYLYCLSEGEPDQAN